MNILRIIFMQILIKLKYQCHLGTNFFPIFDWIKKLGIRDLVVNKFSISIHNRSRVSRFCSQTIPFWTKSDPEMTLSNNLGYARSLICVATIFLATVTHAVEPIKIGSIDTYTTWADSVSSYRNGVKLALKEINNSGGLLNRPVEVLFRDDKGDPAEAMRLAEELMSRDESHLLMGYIYSNVSRAVSEFAKRKKVLYVGTGGADSITLEEANRYTFVFETSTYTLAKIVSEIIRDIEGNKIASVAPNYEFGHSMIKALKEQLAIIRPDIKWVAEQYPALGKMNAGATVAAIERSKPDIIIDSTFSSDHVAFVREGRKRELFNGRDVIGIASGWIEEMAPLGRENPTDWTVLGYPGGGINTPAHDAFEKAYEAEFNESLRLGAFYGYSMMHAVASAIKKAGTLETEALVDAMKGIEFQTPIGELAFRSIDHRSTFGNWVGKIAISDDGVPSMTNFKYYGGEDYMPSEKIVKKRRPQN